MLGGELRCGIPPTVTDPNWRLKPLQCTERFIISIIISQNKTSRIESAHCSSIVNSIATLFKIPFITCTRRNTIHSVTGIRSNKYCGSVKCIYWLELSPSPAHRRVRPHSEAMLKSNVTRDKVDTPMQILFEIIRGGPRMSSHCVQRRFCGKYTSIMI